MPNLELLFSRTVTANLQCQSLSNSNVHVTELLVNHTSKMLSLDGVPLGACEQDELRKIEPKWLEPKGLTLKVNIGAFTGLNRGLDI